MCGVAGVGRRPASVGERYHIPPTLGARALRLLLPRVDLDYGHSMVLKEAAAGVIRALVLVPCVNVSV